MAYFTSDNTAGYSAADLAALNAAWAKLPISAADADDMADASAQDHAAERLLAAYDAGMRGADLVAAAA